MKSSQKPFLTHFAIKREIPFDHAKIRIRYNDELDYLDYNEIEAEQTEFFASGTRTLVKTEAPDFDSELDRFFLETQTITEVKPERPDKPSEAYAFFLATKTSTAVEAESDDED